MTTPKFCRIAIIVDDMDSFIAETSALLGMPYILPSMDALFEDFTVMFGEHGLEPIALHRPVAFAANGRLIEVAIDVDSAEATKAKLAEGGYAPIVTSYLPAPDKNEYLFGRDFHGLPLMVCTAGDNETQMRVQGPFAALADAACPKIGCVTVSVADLDATAADLARYFGMAFVETDPAGLGARALAGTHRVRLIEGPSALVTGEPPLVSIDFMVDDVEAVRERFVAAGFPVRHERALRSGGSAYYFGVTVQHMPVSIYPAAADAEMLGR